MVFNNGFTHLQSQNIPYTLYLFLYFWKTKCNHPKLFWWSKLPMRLAVEPICLSKWKMKVSRLFLWQSNLCKWRFPMNTAHNINCLVMATCRPICLYVSLKTTKRGQIKNIFAFLYEWLMPLNCVYKLKSFWNWYLLFL